MHVIDKNGQRVNRANGILQDGDRMHVVGIHDSRMADIQGAAAAAARAAQKLKRIEAFDKKAVLAEADRLPPFQKAVFKEARSRLELDDALRFAKSVRTSVAPASVSDNRNAEVFGLSPEGYQEFEAAKGRGLSDDDALAAAKGITSPQVQHRPGYLVSDQAGAQEQTRDAYQARLLNAWKDPPALSTSDQQPSQPTTTQPVASSSSDERIAARDRRISEAWMRP